MRPAPSESVVAMALTAPTPAPTAPPISQRRIIRYVPHTAAASPATSTATSRHHDAWAG